MGLAAISVEEKSAFGKDVGEDLIRHHGKKRYYTVKEVKDSVQRRDYPMDWSCWAFCLFTSPEEFTAYHDRMGESCDYGGMKAEMVSAMTDGASTSWFDANMSWLEWPDIDLTSIFDCLDL